MQKENAANTVTQRKCSRPLGAVMSFHPRERHRTYQLSVWYGADEAVSEEKKKVMVGGKLESGEAT